MNRAPAVRKLSLVGFSVLAIAGASTVGGSGCSLNTSGITDPGPPIGERGIGGSTPITTGTGGNGGSTVASGGSPGSGGLSGSGGTTGGTGGATDTPGVGGSAINGSGGSGAVTGSGGTVEGTGGTSVAGVGGVMGTGGAGVGGVVGIGGRGVGGMGTGGMGTGGSIVVNGCADGTREAFTNIQTFPSIAGCSGGWAIPGVATVPSNTAMCARAAGNDGARPNGNGCSIEDLCAVGWHVCRGANELDALDVTCAQARLPPANGAMGVGPLFFATRQRGVQGDVCNANDVVGTNDIHGCGNFGRAEDNGCAPLDRQMSHTECAQAPPWFCGDNNTGATEAVLVTKSGPAAGGVLCCH